MLWQVVRSAICPSVTLRYHDHIRNLELGWNTSKIISWLISLWSSLSAKSNIMSALQVNTTNRSGVWKKSVYELRYIEL